MKYSGLYFVSNPGAQLDASLHLVQSIVNGIESHFQRANRQSLAWKLNHRLLRDMPSNTRQSGDATPSNHAYTYHHLLHLSYLTQNRTYDFVQPPAQNKPVEQDEELKLAPVHEKGVVVAIPVEQTDSHYSLLVNQWAQLWSAQRVLDVPQGITYVAGDFTIHIGELRQRRQGPQTTNILSPGVVVCISTTAGSPDEDPEDAGFDNPDFPPFEEDVDFADVQEIIRQLWKDIKTGIDFGKSEIREYMQTSQDVSGSQDKEREAVVRMWCEALRTRG